MIIMGLKQGRRGTSNHLAPVMLNSKHMCFSVKSMIKYITPISLVHNCLCYTILSRRPYVFITFNISMGPSAFFFLSCSAPNMKCSDLFGVPGNKFLKTPQLLSWRSLPQGLLYITYLCFLFSDITKPFMGK